ncbi:MAG: class I SAM-dependent methyltransferase [Proteobacteria bacterium]|nr:class I SAM-dependent methyltransferase [Pseudomonadota bacterium]
MPALIIVSTSFRQFGAADVERVLNNLLGNPAIVPPVADAARDGAVIVHPSSIAFERARFSDVIPYDTEIGLEKHPEVWRPLRQRRFDSITVLGLDPVADHEAIILACYLEADDKRFIDRRGVHDLAPWQAQVRPDLRPREVRVRRLGPERQRDYLRTVHRWLGDQLVKADFDPPIPATHRDPEVSDYWYPRLATDLAQQTLDLLPEEHGASFSTLMLRDGSLVHTSDFYRAIANFVIAVEGMDSVLDVGCGSGFLACYLAASGRYKSVLGTDSSPWRINGARLHAELHGSAARFDVMTMTNIQLPDKSVDISVTSYALEQTGEHLERCFSEIRRVTRKLIVLVEPTNEFFATLPSLWHIPARGWANQYYSMLSKSGLAFAMRPSLLYHYFNPGTVFVIDLQHRDHPCLRYPQLFGPGVEAWPGGVTVS